MSSDAFATTAHAERWIGGARLRIAVDQLARGGDRRRVLLHLVQVVDGGAQHLRGVLVSREALDEPERAVDRLAPGDGLLLSARPLLALAVRVDRRVAGGGGLLVLGILVRRALVLPRRIAEVLVLEQQLGEVVVDGRRALVLGERGEVGAVPARRLVEVRRLLVLVLRILVERVVVTGQVLQVGLQVADDLRRLLHVEVAPVLGLQTVLRRERLLRLEHQLREAARLVDLDHAHAEARRRPVQRMELDERVVGRRGVLVAALVEVELRQVAVDPILVPAASVRLEVLRDDVRTAEVREAEADDAIRVRDPALFVLVRRVVEVVPGRDLVVEQRDELVERLFVEILLVERPAELVEGELVVLGAGARLARSPNSSPRPSATSSA